MASDKLTHLDDTGRVHMVDVGGKGATERRAVFECRVVLAPETYRLLKEQGMPKGDVLTTARIAGIQGAKQTASLIPLCHPVGLSYADVRFSLLDEASSLRIEAEARTTGPTGVEMEALVAAQTAAMTVYDMCKGVQRDIEITDCRLKHKSGGRSGTYEAGEPERPG
jgi:cyclic pyranopterin phosphate synthase